MTEQVILLDLRNVRSLQFWREIKNFDPDVIHLIPGPTPHGLLLLSMLSGWTDAHSVSTATQPRKVGVIRRSRRILAPDLLIVQSTDLKDRFSSAGFSTKFIPSGVDLNKFKPINGESKKEMRRQLDLPEEERIFLHVGHFKRGRDVLSLTSLTEFGEVVVVGSTSTDPDQEVISALKSSGCNVVTEFIEHIEEYYRAADVYVFPTQDSQHSIQVPLSVFEAMACDLPVITTKFGGLTDCFNEGEGLRFIESFDAITEEQVEFGEVSTRDKVSEYSWETIAREVLRSYRQL